MAFVGRCMVGAAFPPEPIAPDKCVGVIAPRNLRAVGAVLVVGRALVAISGVMRAVVLGFVQVIIVVVAGLVLARVVPGFMRVAFVVAMIVVGGATRDWRRVGAVVLVFV